MTTSPLEEAARRISNLETENAALHELAQRLNAAINGQVDFRALAADLVKSYARNLGTPDELTGKSLEVRTRAMLRALTEHGVRVAAAVMPTRFEVG